MPHFQIKNHQGDVLFEGDFGMLVQCVETAANARADLYGADLSGADLYGANLYGADLYNANLYNANLYNADLRGADLRGANLTRASLSGARLDGANLTRASLSGANLYGANLYGARLDGADLTGAVLHFGIKLRAHRKVCSRTDGHEFRLWDCEDGVWRLTAGCRLFTLPEAWAHWSRTRDGTPLGEETYDILVLFEHQAERDDAARKRL